MIIEAVAWVTKYFVAASVDRGFFLLIRAMRSGIEPIRV